MNLFMAFLIGLAVNLDNLLIGISMGLRGRRLSLSQNLVIGVVTGLCAFLSTAAARLISDSFLIYANLTAAAVTILFGVLCLYQSIPDAETPVPFLSQAEETSGTKPRFTNTLLLSFVLAVNCIPPSLGAGLMGLSPLWVGGFSMLFSFLSIQASSLFGCRIRSCRFCGWLTPLSAVLLILIGFAELLIR